MWWKMIDCKCDFDKASFGSKVYCKQCGMDIGFNPFKVSNNGKMQLYCCEGCT